MSVVPIAAVQTDVRFADVRHNFQRTLDQLRTAQTGGAKLVIFPECVLSGYTFESRAAAMEIAVSQTDPMFDELAEHCRTLEVYVTLGYLERDGERLFNASSVVGPDGIVGHYRKIHLPNLGVDQFVDRGDIPYRGHRVRGGGFSSIDPPPSVGLAICYDCSFPEPMRVLGLEQVDIVALGTNWPVAAARTAEVVPPARSMENHYYFVAANRIGHENGFDFCGRSSICGPDGAVLAACDDDSEIILHAEVDLQIARTKRIERTAGKHSIDRFADRRPEFYGPIGKQGGSAG